MASVRGTNYTFTIYVLTFEKQKQGKHKKAQIVVDEIITSKPSILLRIGQLLQNVSKTQSGQMSSTRI